MADELERARKRESKLVAVFSAIDARADAEAALGEALVELRDLGVAQADLAEMTGLSAREVGAAIRAAKDNTTDTDDAANDAADGDTTAAGQTPADTNGEQQH